MAGEPSRYAERAMNDPNRFDPGSVDTFRIVDNEYEHSSRTAYLRYALDDRYSFEETVTFETEPPPGIPVDGGGLDRALRHLHVAAGTSYYKAAAPPVVVVEGTGLSASELEFHRRLYDDGTPARTRRDRFLPPRPPGGRLPCSSWCPRRRAGGARPDRDHRHRRGCPAGAPFRRSPSPRTSICRPTHSGGTRSARSVRTRCRRYGRCRRTRDRTGSGHSWRAQRTGSVQLPLRCSGTRRLSSRVDSSSSRSWSNGASDDAERLCRSSGSSVRSYSSHWEGNGSDPATPGGPTWWLVSHSSNRS